jgi:hemerythrin-like domain-containing protein
MSVESLFATPGAGFEAPFEMLAACHERVERSLKLLERLGEHLQRKGADAQAQGAARDVMRYFDLAAPHHHEDEERHVLPVLRASGQGDLADRIAADHRAMSAAWVLVREDLAAVVQGHASAVIGDAPRERWRDFAALYRAHAALEDASAFPVAAAALDADAQRAMGDEMARRRGVAPSAGLEARPSVPRRRSPDA